MKKFSSLIILFFGLVYLSSAQSVTIGNQIWMTKNLDVSTFRNGDPIPEAKTEEEWYLAGQNGEPAWCYYDNDPTNGEKYGKLYNWYAVNDPRGLAPEGWHVPNDSEWTNLVTFLGGEDLAGAKMKTPLGWEDNSPEVNDSWEGTNESGFSALPGGSRTAVGYFSILGGGGFWWSSTEVEEDPFKYIQDITLYSEFALAIIGLGEDRSEGKSVRCIKD
jgi:uncharacterized protein (TIGR02145 family)